MGGTRNTTARKANKAVGFDIGGQSVKAVRVDSNGRVLAETSRPTGKSTTGESLMASLVSARDELCSGEADSVVCGVGVAGVMSADGRLQGSPNLPGIEDIEIGRLCHGALSPLGAGVPVDNDANCAALGEGWNGAATGESDFLMLTLGTGVGSGLVLGGEIYRGATGHGCEFGHAVLMRGGRTCGCGNRGCLEAYVSEVAACSLVADASEPLRDVVAQQTRAGGGAAQVLFATAEGGNREADKLVVEMTSALGAGIASAVNIFDVEVIVLGGGIAGDILKRRGELEVAVAASLFARSIAALRIRAAEHGPLAGAIGAARLAMFGETATADKSVT